MNEVFTKLDQAHRTGGSDALLTAAEQHLRGQQRYHELFEILKMKARQQLGLPLLHNEGSDSLGEEDLRLIEDKLLETCRDVGLSLLRAGQIQDGWLYLRHLADNKLVLAEMANIEVNEENLDQVLGVLLHEGLDTRRGYELVLEHYGTCNAITTMQSTLYGRGKHERQAAGRLLVAHVHAELVENVRAHIEREEPDAPQHNRLVDLIAGRDWLCAEGAYHIDTSHLSSTVQIAEELAEPSSLELALDLTRYGQNLDPNLQYAGDPPFEDIYPSHEKFFAAQLGQDVDDALAFFRQRAAATDAHQEGTQAIEVYIDLLARTGRPEEALEATTALIPAGIQSTGRAPSLYELSEQLGSFTRFQEICRDRSDLIGYVLSLHDSKT